MEYVCLFSGPKKMDNFLKSNISRSVILNRKDTEIDSALIDGAHEPIYQLVRSGLLPLFILKEDLKLGKF